MPVGKPHFNHVVNLKRILGELSFFRYKIRVKILLNALLENHAHNKLLSFEQIRKLLHVICQICPDFIVFIVCPKYVYITFFQTGQQPGQKAQC